MDLYKNQFGSTNIIRTGSVTAEKKIQTYLNQGNEILPWVCCLKMLVM